MRLRRGGCSRVFAFLRSDFVRALFDGHLLHGIWRSSAAPAAAPSRSSAARSSDQPRWTAASICAPCCLACTINLLAGDVDLAFCCSSCILTALQASAAWAAERPAGPSASASPPRCGERADGQQFQRNVRRDHVLDHWHQLHQDLPGAILLVGLDGLSSTMMSYSELATASLVSGTYCFMSSPTIRTRRPSARWFWIRNSITRP
jgi:hypothetical protein